MRLKMKIYYIIGIILFIPLISSAKELTLSEAIKIALDRSLKIKKMAEMTKAADLTLKSTKAERFPNLTTELSIGYNKIISTLEEPTTITIMEYEVTIPEPPHPPWNNAISLELSQPLYTGGKISNLIKMAEIIKESSVYKRKLAEIELCFNVVQAYWELKKALLLKELYKDRVEYAKGMLKIANEKFRLGEISKIEVQQHEVTLSNILCDLFHIEDSIDVLQQRLSLLLNINKEIIPADNPQVPKKFSYKLPELIKKALSQRVEIQLAKYRVQEKRRAVKIAKSNKYPQVYITAYHNWANKEDEFTKSIFKTEATEWQVALTLGLLLFDGRQTSVKVEKALAELKMAEMELEDIKSKVRNEVACAYKRLVRLKQIIQTQTRNLSLAEENLKIAVLQYKLGKITNTQVNEIELALKETKVELIKAEIDYKIYEAKLKKAIGEDNEEY
jgi:outer membrane protein TolC